MTVSCFSRYSVFWPMSSARPQTTSTLLSDKFSVSSDKKTVRLRKESTSVNFKSGRIIANGMPGNPAPAPTSITLAPGNSVVRVSSATESPKCFTATSNGSTIRVKLIFSLYSIKKSSNIANLSSCSFVTSTFSSLNTCCRWGSIDSLCFVICPPS